MQTCCDLSRSNLWVNSIESRMIQGSWIDFMQLENFDNFHVWVYDVITPPYAMEYNQSRSCVCEFHSSAKKSKCSTSFCLLYVFASHLNCLSSFCSGFLSSMVGFFSCSLIFYLLLSRIPHFKVHAHLCLLPLSFPPSDFPTSSFADDSLSKSMGSSTHILRVLMKVSSSFKTSHMILHPSFCWVLFCWLK